MSGKLTTHVLDTAHGCPAKGIAIALWQLDTNLELDFKTLIHTVNTNDDGRTDEPLLVGETFKTGVYELIFSVGDYFAQYSEASAPLFLDRIPIRFGISDPEAHYHVPLLVSPWSYSTYRGS
ncbi:5-hydroxyisourate hydrolase 2 [Hyella patelloides LEGE 07179]|uniref:5-hydroxyisourate hydrolase n=1 Tax=Hyella patelloides LEGE 07179 TaxID=945734 RepID=A0A563VVW6_9CYAN|nr:hydroxyisourate hydrolase [Hyella patelloides]VEP15604.1 5-hydroxyisourate hydrolase 2 [Hyella patelloides LEGE 07179]